MTTSFIINHLWQSSCFALLAGLLAFVLRKNSPKVRYWVWLSASLKFLIPFALLVSLGGVVPRPTRHPVSVAAPVFPNTLVQIAQPFSPTLKPTVSVHTPLDWAPVAIGVVWVLGFLAIMLGRCRSWLGFRAALRTSTPVELPIPDTGTDHAWRGGTGRRGFSASGPGSTGPLPGTPESSTAWRDSHARTLPRETPGQSLRRRAHDGGGDLLVPSAGVVDRIAHG